MRSELRNYKITKLLNKKFPQFRHLVIPSFSNSQSAYTLIELLTVIAIISLLIGILVPTISRSLTKNTLSSDIDVLRSKIEETRLLAGSSQTNDTAQGSQIGTIQRVGYYGIYFPTATEIGNGKPFYAIVRLSAQPWTHEEAGYCSPRLIALEALAGSGFCLIERIDLSTNATYDVTTIKQERLIAFTVPSQQLVDIYQKTGCNPTLANSYCFIINPKGPVFDQTTTVGGSYLTLNYRDKTATITIEPYTGKLRADYN